MRLDDGGRFPPPIIAVLILVGACGGNVTNGTTTSLSDTPGSSATSSVSSTTLATAAVPDSAAAPSVSTGIPEWDELLAKYDLQPIEGYGDFSGQTHFEFDRAETTPLLMQCMRDQGFPVTSSSPGSVSFSQVPPEQNELAYATYVACNVGMKIPRSQPHNEEQLREIYAYGLALVPCLEAEGYVLQGEVPSADGFVESKGLWSPYEYSGLPNGGPEWDHINRICPQTPVGGYGKWDPGDPVEPQP